ncbi:recombinase family protein [Actinoplanes sp. CA-142083]|uniref:recombinase family protein n=1 Tax=Actinoplanes sp. CA-142083 TaxID=3239903 RepID=UPI003D93D723
MEAAISYARASVDRTGQELSVERQRSDQRKLVRHRGVRLAHEITDNDVSANGRRRRPGFERMLELVREGKADVIVATDMSRLTRGKSSDEARLLELGLETNLKLWFVRAPDLDLSTAAGRLTASILIAAARHEIEQKSERQRRAAEQAAEQGRRIGGRRPFGYDADGTTENKTEADAIRWAYNELLAGAGLGALAREWNRRGLLTPQHGYAHGCGGSCGPKVRPRSCPQRKADRPSLWTAQTIRPVLMNPRYAGLRSHVTDAVRRAHPDPRTARIAGIVGRAQWPSLVSEATWRAAVTKLTDPGRTKPPRSGTAVLTGEALCGARAGADRQVCNATVHGGAAPASRGKPGYRTYRCTASLGHLGRAAEPVEWFVSEVVVERLSRPDAASLLLAPNRPDAAETDRKLVSLRGARRNVLSLVRDGTFSAAEARSETAALDVQIAQLEADLADSARVDLLGPLVRAAEGQPEDQRAAKVRGVWHGMSVDRRRTVISLLMTVRLLPPGRGVRLGQTVETWTRNAEKLAASIEIDWHS